jgi:hypothetical protein
MAIKYTLGLAALLGSMSIADLAHAAGMNTYTNKARGYSLQYPGSWTVKKHAGRTDVEFVAPDTNAIVTATATAGRATEAAIKTQQAKILKGFGTAQGSVAFKAVGINGVTYGLSEVVTKTAQGKLLDVVLLDTVHGAYIYDFDTFLLYKGPTYKADTTTVQRMLNSIKLTK